MKKLILDLYRQIEKEQIKNNIYSKYWIFHIESVLLRDEGVSKRYLKVLFFNRMMNEHDNLLRLYINVNGERIEKDDFVVSSEYHDENIMGFILERDLIDEGEDVTIEAYVVDGKKQELSKEYMVGFPFCDNQQKFQAFMDFTDFLTSEMITAPYFDQEKWVCACGYTNQILDPICPICASKKEKMQELYEMKLERVVLKHCKEGMKLNVNQSYQEILHKYAKEIEQKYGINENEVLSCFDLEALRIEQEQMIDEYIKQYIQEKHVCFTPHSSFESCLDMYYKGICNDIITKDMVESKLDLKQLKEEYEANRLQQIQKSKKQKKTLYLGIAVLVLMSLCFVIYQIFIKENNRTENRSYQGIEVSDMYEYRKSKCENSAEYEEIENLEMKTMMQENALCYIDYSYMQTPRNSIVETETDMVRSLDENYVLIQHKEFIEPSVEKTVRYIADLNGNVVYGNIEHDYTLATYVNERIDHEDIYYNDELVGKNIYVYEDENNFTILQYIDWSEEKDNSPAYTIKFVDGKVSEKIRHDTSLYHYQYIYENDQLSKVIITDTDNEKEKTLEFINGLLEVENYDNEHRDVHVYDKNGLPLQRLYFDELNSLISGTNYFYDFKNGITYEYSWQRLYGYTILPFSLDIRKSNLYLPPDIEFEYEDFFSTANEQLDDRAYDDILELYFPY